MSFYKFTPLCLMRNLPVSEQLIDQVCKCFSILSFNTSFLHFLLLILVFLDVLDIFLKGPIKFTLQCNLTRFVQVVLNH